MNILYQINSLESVYAGRFIYEGYKNAFEDAGHAFKPFTSKEDLNYVLESFKPNIFISGLNRYNLKYLDLALIRKYRDEKGMVFFNQVPAWRGQNSQFVGKGLESDPELVELIKTGLAGDIFFHWLEQDSPYMEGFSDETGQSFETILLAADTSRFFPDFDESYKADISYVGSYLNDKKQFINTHLIPLKKKYNVRTYGSDWNFNDRLIGYIQKGGQYLNIGPLKELREIKLPLDDERKVYTSSTISLNIHENHQRRDGSDFNERTFKIIASGGFEICDNVSILRKYFTEKELVIAEDTNDWFDKIDYYIRNPERRIPIIEAGRKRVLKDHTYTNRVDQIISLYKGINK